MHVERKLGELAHRLDDLRAKGEVRHEAAVHHIDVNPVGAAFLEHRDFIGKLREIGAQNRWRDPNAHSGFGEAGRGSEAGAGAVAGGGGGALMPVSILIDGGCGKWEMVRFTAPAAAVVRAGAGVCLVTVLSLWRYRWMRD